MATNQRFEHTAHATHRIRNGPEPSLGELFRQLSNDTTTLVRSEIALAKAEFREVTRTATRDATKIGIGAALALLGALALTAFLVIALGALIGNYWVSALIVGVLLAGAGALMAKNAVDDIRKRGLAPQQTIQSLREDAEWAKHESREFKRELTK